MSRQTTVFACLAAICGFFISATNATAEIRGSYIESRTCQVYTGPCFANAEVGLSGKNAVMAWQIDSGSHDGVDLSGLSVIMALKATKTLEFRGIEEAGDLKSVIYVDQRANSLQQLALADFAKQHTGRAGKKVVRVTAAPIEMSLNVATLDGKVEVRRTDSARKDVHLVTRKARPGDCICSNESAYYPPLVEVEHCAPGVAIVGEFNGRGLGSRWSTPGDRSAYMAVFNY